MNVSLTTTDRRGLTISWPTLQAAAVIAVVAVAVWQHQALVSGTARLGAVSPTLAGAALVAEIVSFVAVAEVQRRLLAAGNAEVDRRSLVAVDLAGGAIGATLPVGFTFSTAYTYRQFVRRGARPAVAMWVLAASGVLCVAALVVLGLIGAQVSGPGVLSSPLGAVVGVAFAVVALALFGGLVWVSASTSRLETLARRLHGALASALRVLRRHPSDGARDDAGFLGLERPEGVSLGARGWSGLFALAELNWLADIAALAIALAAVGARVPWGGLVFAYVLSQVASSVPLLPGSIGVAEGSLALALVSAGVRPASAVAGVLAYRLITFWMLLPIGWALWARLRRNEIHR
jgi:putative heme transporter